MAPEVVVALITAGAAFTVSLISFPLNHLINQRARRAETLDLMGRYRDPLLWAVHDLRSRIRTILDEDFFNRYLVNVEDRVLGSSDTFIRPYARRSTIFVLAQYLGWVEILRRDIGFLDLGDRRRNRKLVELLSVIRQVLYALDLDPVFHVPTAQQRGVGEIMIAQDHVPPGYGRCIGFATFCQRLDNDRDFAAWFERIDAGIVAYAYHPEQGENRLAELNKCLSDLIDFLDPDLTRFPLRHEERAQYLPFTPSAGSTQRFPHQFTGVQLNDLERPGDRDLQGELGMRNLSLQGIEHRVMLAILPAVVVGSIVANVLSWDVKWQIPLIFAVLYVILSAAAEIRENQGRPPSVHYRSSNEFFTSFSRFVQVAEHRICTTYVRQTPPSSFASPAAERYFNDAIRWMRCNPGGSFYRIIGVPTREPHRTEVLQWLFNHHSEMKDVGNYHARVVSLDSNVDAINVAVIDDKAVLLLLTSDGSFMSGHSLETPASVASFRDYYSSWWASAEPLSEYLAKVSTSP